MFGKLFEANAMGNVEADDIGKIYNQINSLMNSMGINSSQILLYKPVSRDIWRGYWCKGVNLILTTSLDSVTFTHLKQSLLGLAGNNQIDLQVFRETEVREKITELNIYWKSPASSPPLGMNVFRPANYEEFKQKCETLAQSQASPALPRGNP